MVSQEGEECLILFYSPSFRGDQDFLSPSLLFLKIRMCYVADCPNEASRKMIIRAASKNS